MEYQKVFLNGKKSLTVNAVIEGMVDSPSLGGRGSLTGTLWRCSGDNFLLHPERGGLDGLEDLSNSEVGS